jgi:hypothetical protein
LALDPPGDRFDAGLHQRHQKRGGQREGKQAVEALRPRLYPPVTLHGATDREEANQQDRHDSGRAEQIVQLLETLRVT